MYVSVLAAILVQAWAGSCAVLFWHLRGQLTHFSIQEIETVEGLLYFTPQGQLRIKEDYHNHPESKQLIERFVEVLAADRSVLFRNDRLGNRSLGAILPREGVGGYSERSTELSDGTNVRAVSRVHTLDGRRLLIRLAHSEDSLYTRLTDYCFASLMILPAELIIAWIAGFGLARRALKPIEEMARRAQEITPEKMDARLPIDEASDELGQLAKVFNHTLDRLECAFLQLRRFTSDASHELRTPLAMIRAVGEVGLQKDCAREEYRDIIGSMLEDVNRLTSLVESLLTISRAESGHIQLQRTVLSVLALAREVAGLFEVLIEEKSLRLLLRGDETSCVEGDYIFLRQALVNVIHNAIKYSPHNEVISVNVTRRGGNVLVEVRDNGPGVRPEDQSKIFDRFYRVDKSRGQSAGAGLGLSIARWTIEAHGGGIALLSAPGEGCLFVLTLPSADASAIYPEPGKKVIA